MRVKLFTAATMPEALNQARATLGADALIIATRRTQAGVEVTAAIEQPEENFAELPPPPPNLGAALRWHGIPAGLADRLDPMRLAESLERMLRFGPLPAHPHGRPLLLTGPPGAGKTLTIARLATRFVMSGIKPMVITADTRRAGAAEELAAYTRLLGINLVVASQPGNLAAALGHRPPDMPVLIDTAGTNAFHAPQLAAIRGLIDAADAIPALVLGGGLDPLEAADLAEATATLGATFLVPTRLDMTRRIGWIVTASLAGGMALAEAGIGPGATDGLTELTPAFLAARLSETHAPPPQQDAARHVH
jgi:flagellar biosynthesis protein FlhF